MAKKVIYEIEIISDSLDKSNRSIQDYIDRNKELGAALKQVPEQGTAAYKALDDRIKQASNGTQTLADRVNKLKTEFSENRNVVRDFNRELREGEKAANSINSLRQQVIQLNRELDNAEIGSTRFKELTRESAEATKRLKDLEQQTLRFQRNVGNYQSIGQGLINTFNQVGKAIFAAFSIQGLINLTQRAVSDLIQTARDYSQAIATVGAISGATEEQMVSLNAEARRLGESTAFSATSAAEGMIELSRAGFTVEEQLAATEPVLNLAVAANAELGRTSEVAATALRTYGFAAEEAGRVTDVISATFNSSQTSLESFAESFKVLGPSARSLQIPFEEVAGTIGLLGDSGLRGTDATTALRTSLARLASQPAPVAKELQRLNLSAFDQQGQFIGLANLLGELETRYQDFTDEQRQASISLLFGNRALSQVNILLNAQKEVVTENGKEVLKGSDALRGYTEQLRQAGEQAGGFTKAIADQQIDNFNGDIVLLQSATEGLQLALFDLVENNLRSVVQGVRAVVSEFTLFAKGQGELKAFLEENSTLLNVIAILFGSYTAAVIANTIATQINTIAQKVNNAELTKGSALSKAAAIARIAYSNALKVLTGQISIVSGVTKTWTAIQLAINTALTVNPIGLIIVAIGALIAAIVALYQNSQTVRAAVAGIGEAFEAIWERIEPIVTAIGRLLVAQFNIGIQIVTKFYDFVIGIWASIFEYASRYVNAIIDINRKVFEFVSRYFSAIYQAAVRFLGPIITIFDPFITRVREIFSSVYEVVVGVFDDIKEAVIGAVEGIFEFFGIDLTELENAFSDVVDAAQGASEGAGADIAASFNKGFRDRIANEFFEGMQEEIQKAMNQDPSFDFERVKNKIAEALTEGVISQEDADKLLQDFQNQINKSDRTIQTSVTPVNNQNIDPTSTTETTTGGGGGDDAFKKRLEEYQKQAAQLEEVQLRLSERGLEILRQRRLQELAEDRAFQRLRTDEQLLILQEVENDYTEARLKLASDRQKQLNEEREIELEQIQERAVLYRQITTDLGADEVEAIREASTASIQATVQRYEAQTQVIIQQTNQRKEEIRNQLEQSIITEEQYNDQLLQINESSAARLELITEQRDRAIIQTTQNANEQLLQLAQERQDALNEVKVGAVTDITSNFTNQLAELDRLRNEDLISAQEYVNRREEIENQLNEALILVSDQTAETLKGNLEGVYQTQIQEALAFRNDRLEALRGAYSEDAALASAAFEEQRQLLEQRRQEGVIDETEYRNELAVIQTTYYSRINQAQETYQTGSIDAQNSFDQTLITLTEQRTAEIQNIEANRSTDLTSSYQAELAELERLRNENLITAEQFNTRSLQLERTYQNDVKNLQASAQATQIQIDQQAFEARTEAARTFRDENIGTFDAVYQSQVEAISQAANSQQGILESTNETLLSLSQTYNEQSIAQSEQYTNQYAQLVQNRSDQITQIVDSTIVDLSSKFESDLNRLTQLRDQDIISATEYANQVAELQANLQNELATIQENNQANTSEFLALSLQERIQAADLYHQRRLDQLASQRQDEINQANISAEAQLALAKKSLEDRKITEDEYASEVENITNDKTRKLESIEAAYRTNTLAEDKRFTDERKKTIEDYLSEIDLTYQNEQVDLTSQFNDQLAELTHLRTSDIISAEQYAEARKKIENELEDELLKAELTRVQAKLSVAEAGSQEYLRLKNQELSLTKQLLDDEVQATEEAEKTKQQLIQETREAQQQALDSIKNALSSITSFVSQGVENRIVVLEQERDTILEGIEARRAEVEAQFESFQASLQIQNLTEEERQKQLEQAEIDKEIKLQLLQEEEEKTKETKEKEIEAEELKVARLQDIEGRLQAFRDLMTSLQVANDNLRALTASQASAQIIASNAAETASEGAKAVAKTAGSVPFPANLIAIVGLVAALASAIASVRRLVGKSPAIAQAKEGGLIEIYPEDVQYMKSGGQSGARKKIRTTRRSERRRNVRRVMKVPRGKRISLGKPHNSDGTLGGGLLTELERGEWVVPVQGVNMFKTQLAWMTEQANAKAKGQPFTSTFPEELFPTKPVSEIRRYVPSASRPPVINQPVRYSSGFAAEGGEIFSGLSGAISATDLDETNNLLREVSFKLDVVASAAKEGKEINLSLIRLREKQTQLDESETRAST